MANYRGRILEVNSDSMLDRLTEAFKKSGKDPAQLYVMAESRKVPSLPYERRPLGKVRI